MITNEDIFKVAAVVFSIGFVSSIAILVLTKPLYVPVKDIDRNLLGHRVETSGTIKYIYSRNGHYFLTLENQSRIKVVFFSTQAKRNNLQSFRKGDAITVVGKVNEYKSEIEIIGEQIFKR